MNHRTRKWSVGLHEFLKQFQITVQKYRLFDKTSQFDILPCVLYQFVIHPATLHRETLEKATNGYIVTTFESGIGQTTCRLDLNNFKLVTSPHSCTKKNVITEVHDVNSKYLKSSDKE